MTARPRDGRPYHHGDLKAALLQQAEHILEQHGLPALTLRAVARAAGVSHAAPTNHFGDLTGLLSELAASGFTRFAAALAVAMTTGGEPRDGVKAMGRAYVGFARAHPGLFALMFRSERLDPARPSLQAAIGKARNALRTGAATRAPAGAPSALQQAAQAVALWSLVHGFSMLLLERRLDGIIGALPDAEPTEALLEAVLGTTRVGD